MKNNIIITVSTALNSSNISIQQRLSEYQECFSILKNLGHENFYIIETVLDKSTFLESHSKNVYYTNVNKNYSNRGSDFVNAYRKFINNSQFEDDDLIIHITGRYPLVNNSFFESCKNLDHNKIGCFAKDPYNQFYLFLCALRFKQLKSLLNSINVEEMELFRVNLERIYADKLPHELIQFVDKLGIIGRQSNETDMSRYGRIIF